MTIKALTKHSGFTLLEVLVTIAIASILMAIAVPSFSNTINRSALSSTINEINSSLNYARSEAIKRGATVSILSKTAGSWAGGWDVFVDVNGNGAFDVGDTNIRSNESVRSNFTVHTTGDANFYTFTKNGLSNLAAISYIVVCNTSNSSTPVAFSSKVLYMNIIGLINLAADTNADNIPDKLPGANITSCITPF